MREGGIQPERFLIVGAGRTGSSLLCAVLASAGADFGMSADQIWSPDTGAFEQAAVTRAAAWLNFANRLAVGRPVGPQRWIWNGARHLAKMHLRTALAAAQFIKGPNLDLAIQLTVKLGYIPRLVISHRSFAAQATSAALRSAGLTVAAIEASYLRTYKNALMWLYVYGGCAVDFDDLVDRKRVEWLYALAELTGLSPDRMEATRRARLAHPGSRPIRLPVLSPECECLHEALRKLSGQVVHPSRLAMRAIPAGLRAEEAASA